MKITLTASEYLQMTTDITPLSENNYEAPQTININCVIFSVIYMCICYVSDICLPLLSCQLKEKVLFPQLSQHLNLLEESIPTSYTKTHSISAY